MRHQFGHIVRGVGGLRHAKQLVERTCRVRQRSEEVEDGANSQFAAGRAREAHRGVERLCEHKTHAHLVDAPAHRLRTQFQLHTVRIEDVRGAHATGCRAVPMLRHPHPSRGHGQRRGGGDVERPQPVAAGAHNVHQLPVGFDVKRLLAHHARHAGERFHRLAGETQRNQECADLRRRGLACHDVFRDGGRFLFRERLPRHQFAYRFLNHGASSVASLRPSTTRISSNSAPSAAAI